MTGQHAELMPIITTDAEGNTVFLCGVCKARFSFDSFARFCAAQDAALLECVPVL